MTLVLFRADVESNPTAVVVVALSDSTDVVELLAPDEIDALAFCAMDVVVLRETETDDTRTVSVMVAFGGFDVVLL